LRDKSFIACTSEVKYLFISISLIMTYYMKISNFKTIDADKK
jgi:hypothetical protein